MKPFRCAKFVAPMAGLILTAWPAATLLAQARPAAHAANPAPKAQKQAEQQAARQAAQQARKQANNSVIRPGDVALQRFVNMTPEERQAAISKLPPQQQALRSCSALQAYENMTPQAKERLNSQLDLMRSLPPKRQNQIRQSLRDVNTLPPPRRQAVRQELARMGNMTEEQRDARLNSEEFRNTFSPGEQTMIGNIAAVLPQKN